MAGNEEGDEAPPRGNEWEFVNLTASAYAASPVDLNHGNSVGENEIEASDLMFVSGHFVFPPSRHANLPPEPQNSEMNDVECGEFDVPQLNAGEERGKPDDNDASFEELMSDKFPEDLVLDEISNTLLASSADFQEDLIVDKEEKSAESHEDSRFLNCEEEKFDCEEVPCEAWWKRRAVSLFSQAKEANSFWSVFITAAVMGIVIIGHHWNKKKVACFANQVILCVSVQACFLFITIKEYFSLLEIGAVFHILILSFSHTCFMTDVFHQ